MFVEWACLVWIQGVVIQWNNWCSRWWFVNEMFRPIRKQRQRKMKIGISILNAWMTQNFGSDLVRLLVDKKLHGTRKKKCRGLINGAPTTQPPSITRLGGDATDFIFLHFSVIELYSWHWKNSTDRPGHRATRAGGAEYSTLGWAWPEPRWFMPSTDN